MVNGNERLVEMGPFGIFLAFVLFVWMFFSQVLNYVFHATAFRAPEKPNAHKNCRILSGYGSFVFRKC